MASSDEAPTSELSIPVPRETLEIDKESPDKKSIAVQVEESIACEEGEKEQSTQRNGDSLNGGGLGSSCLEGGDTKKTLERVDELLKEGSKAFVDGDTVDSVDCVRRALKIRVAHHGERAPECAISYYQYGWVLLYKALEKDFRLSNDPKSSPRNPEKDVSGSFKASARDAKQDSDSISNDEVEEGSGDKDQEDGNKGSEGDNEDLAEEDKDDPDLDLAWEMLNVAMEIVEDNEELPGNKMVKVNIFAALGEVSMRRGYIRTSLSYYLQALSVLKQLVEPDNVQIAELYFRICLVLVFGFRFKDTMICFEEAMSVCKSHLQQLREDLRNMTAVAATNMNSLSDSGESGNQFSVGVYSNPSSLEIEKGIDAVGEIVNKFEIMLKLLQEEFKPKLKL